MIRCFLNSINIGSRFVFQDKLAYSHSEEPDGKEGERKNVGSPSPNGPDSSGNTDYVRAKVAGKSIVDWGFSRPFKGPDPEEVNRRMLANVEHQLAEQDRFGFKVAEFRVGKKNNSPRSKAELILSAPALPSVPPPAGCVYELTQYKKDPADGELHAVFTEMFALKIDKTAKGAPTKVCDVPPGATVIGTGKIYPNRSDGTMFAQVTYLDSGGVAHAGLVPMRYLRVVGSQPNLDAQKLQLASEWLYAVKSTPPDRIIPKGATLFVHLNSGTPEDQRFAYVPGKKGAPPEKIPLTLGQQVTSAGRASFGYLGAPRYMVSIGGRLATVHPNVLKLNSNPPSTSEQKGPEALALN